jgi:hypothetical protein
VPVAPVTRTSRVIYQTISLSHRVDPNLFDVDGAVNLSGMN